MWSSSYPPHHLPTSQTGLLIVPAQVQWGAGKKTRAWIELAPSSISVTCAQLVVPKGTSRTAAGLGVPSPPRDHSPAGMCSGLVASSPPLGPLGERSRGWSTPAPGNQSPIPLGHSGSQALLRASPAGHPPSPLPARQHVKPWVWLTLCAPEMPRYTHITQPSGLVPWRPFLPG